jgi:hypothetical protein
MSECPPKKSEAELEADVDYMLDTIAADIKSGNLTMTSDAVKQRVVEILKKRGMLKGGASKKSRRKSRTRRTSSRRGSKRNTKRRRR